MRGTMGTRGIYGIQLYKGYERYDVYMGCPGVCGVSGGMQGIRGYKCNFFRDFSLVHLGYEILKHGDCNIIVDSKSRVSDAEEQRVEIS